MVIPGHNLGNSQVSVYRTIGPTLVLNFGEIISFLVEKSNISLYGIITIKRSLIQP